GKRLSERMGRLLRMLPDQHFALRSVGFGLQPFCPRLVRDTEEPQPALPQVRSGEVVGTERVVDGDSANEGLAYGPGDRPAQVRLEKCSLEMERASRHTLIQTREDGLGEHPVTAAWILHLAQ